MQIGKWQKGEGAMPDVERLKRGLEFQQEVYQDFLKHSKDGRVDVETQVSFKGVESVHQKRGRIDVFISGLEDMVVIIEVKATDWNRIKPKNINRNLYRHQKQIFNYIEKYITIDHVDVGHGIVYPKPPRDPTLKEYIETRMLDYYGVPVYWFTDIKWKKPKKRSSDAKKKAR